MTAVVNPKTVTVTDAAFASQNGTAFVFNVGTATGGPYTTATATVPVASFTVANGVYSAPFMDLTFSPPLLPFTNYFMVADAQNAQGTSGGSPEVSFQVETAPSAPTALALA